ncbi:patatin-like phospholipase family protein [bacterium]|nr:patatin-like phospholipase family protein [bacterium]
MSRIKVGIALGGGAARGLAHLGILEVLRGEGIPIDLVAGTSMGALVGAMYCADGGIDGAVKRTEEFLGAPAFKNSRIHMLRRRSDEEEEGLTAMQLVASYIARGRVIASTVTRPSVLEEADLKALIGSFLDDRDIATFPVPFRAVVTDLALGEEVALARGSVLDAVAASSAVPGAFPPIMIDGRAYCDGGVVNMVPVTVARGMGADYVIAANVIHEPPEADLSARALELYFRTHYITRIALTRLQLRFADIVLTPPVGHIHWADFTRADTMVEAGREIARQNVDRIREDLRRLARRPRFLRRRRPGMVA